MSKMPLKDKNKKERNTNKKERKNDGANKP